MWGPRWQALGGWGLEGRGPGPWQPRRSGRCRRHPPWCKRVLSDATRQRPRGRDRLRRHTRHALCGLHLRSTGQVGRGRAGPEPLLVALRHVAHHHRVPIPRRGTRGKGARDAKTFFCSHEAHPDRPLPRLGPPPAADAFPASGPGCFWPCHCPRRSPWGWGMPTSRSASPGEEKSASSGGASRWLSSALQCQRQDGTPSVSEGRAPSGRQGPPKGGGGAEAGLAARLKHRQSSAGGSDSTTGHGLPPQTRTMLRKRAGSTCGRRGRSQPPAHCTWRGRQGLTARTLPARVRSGPKSQSSSKENSARTE